MTESICCADPASSMVGRAAAFIPTENFPAVTVSILQRCFSAPPQTSRQTWALQRRALLALSGKVSASEKFDEYLVA